MPLQPAGVTPRVRDASATPHPSGRRIKSISRTYRVLTSGSLLQADGHTFRSAKRIGKEDQGQKAYTVIGFVSQQTKGLSRVRNPLR
jgi:hypothetical protein